MSDPVKLSLRSDKVLFDSVEDVLCRSIKYATTDPKTSSVLIISSYKRDNGDFVVVCDGNTSYQQRLLLLELARAKTLEDMGFA